MNCILQAPAWAHSKEDIPAWFPVAQTSICICSVLNYFSNASTFWCCWYSFFFFKLNDLTENYRSYCFCHWGKKTKNKKKIPDWERANFRLVSQKLFDLFSQTFELVSWHFEILKSKRWDTDLKFWLLDGKIFSFVFFFFFFQIQRWKQASTENRSKTHCCWNTAIGRQMLSLRRTQKIHCGTCSFAHKLW